MTRTAQRGELEQLKQVLSYRLGIYWGLSGCQRKQQRKMIQAWIANIRIVRSGRKIPF